jgi:hypothetical protein
MAERYGAKALDPSAPDFKTTLKTACGDRGPDVVLEVVGHPGALYSALELVRVAGVVSSCGVHIAPLTMVGNDLYAKGVKMVFGRCHVRGVFEESMGLLKRVTEKTPELIDEFVQKTIGIDEAEEVSCLAGIAGIRSGLFADIPFFASSSTTSSSTSKRSARSYLGLNNQSSNLAAQDRMPGLQSKQLYEISGGRSWQPCLADTTSSSNRPGYKFKLPRFALGSYEAVSPISTEIAPRFFIASTVSSHECLNVKCIHPGSDYLRLASASDSCL